MQQLPHDHHCPWRELAESMERRFGAIIAEQQDLIRRQAEVIAELERKLGEKEREHTARVQALEVEVARLERALIGRKSEKLKVPPADRDLRTDESPSDEDLARQREEAEKKRRERALAKNAVLAVEDVDHPVAEDLKTCPSCGCTEYRELPPETSTTIDYVPGRFVRRRNRRQKIVRSCQCEGRIVTATAPPKLVAGGHYGPGFAAFLIVEKFADSIPIYRIEKRFGRLGIPISRATMNDVVHAAAEIVRPLVARLTKRIAEVEIVLADETSMRLQDRQKKGFVWVFHGRDERGSDGQLVLYVFATDRSGDTPIKILGGTEGTLLVDGYSGYNRGRGSRAARPRRMLVPCAPKVLRGRGNCTRRMRSCDRRNPEALSRRARSDDSTHRRKSRSPRAPTREEQARAG